MAHEIFEVYSPRAESKALLGVIQHIVDTYAAEGLVLTLRQLYYQLVSRDVIPNDDRAYDRIGTIVSKARRGGHLDWDALEDRIRRPQAAPEFANLSELVQAAIDAYRLPRHSNQEHYIELWVEKDALASVLWPIADRYHITLMVNRGYSSTSAMKDAGERIRKKCKGRTSIAHILYLGDLDPSGEDMVRDIDKRLDDYVNSGWILNRRMNKLVPESRQAHLARLDPFINVIVSKLALTPEQVAEYEPPPNPAKRSDSRYAKFRKIHGDESYEVDALPPAVLRQIIEERLDELIDRSLVRAIERQEQLDKERFEEIATALLNPPRKPKKRKRSKRLSGKPRT